MNMFIKLMEEDGTVSIKKLKQIYRLVSKKVHPDISKGEDIHFVRIKDSYEEALHLLESDEYVKSRLINTADLRKALLKDLYLFSMKIFTKKADELLAEMINLARSYDKEVENLLRRYRNILYRNNENWRTIGKIYYAHNVLMVCIKQLFIYYNNRNENQLRIFRGYKQALESWTYNLEDKQKELLGDFFNWLMKESDGKPVANYEYS